MFRPSLFLSCLVLAGQFSLALASQPATVDGIPDPSVEAEQKAFIVPEGYELNLWAAEPLLRKPVQMNWDAQGRLWVVCSTTYPQIKPGEAAIDEIVVVEDTDRDGKADKSTLFADNLHIPTALIPADGGCYVANSTEILFLKDTDGDGKADVRKTMLSGFGTEDTHHLIHTFRFTPEGMISFNQSIYIHSHVETPWGVRRLMGGGIWNYRPELRRLDVVAKGLINPWGTEYDRWGQCFATDGAGSEGINYVFPGAVFATSPGAKRIVRGLNPGQPKQCGLDIIEEPHFPDDWQGTFVTCDFRGNRINRFQLTESGSGYVSKQMPDVLASTHRGFRPIDVRTGPDGALYIADWFNPIIQHGEVDFRDPRRDRVHGRIWRLTAKGRPLSEPVDFVKAKEGELLDHLKSSRRWNRTFAKRELRGREPQLAAASVDEWAFALPPDDPNYWQNLLEAAWARESQNAPDALLNEKLLSSPDARVRAAGLRLLSHHLETTPNALKSLEKAISDENAQVRLWALSCLNLLSKAAAIPVALRVLDKPMDDNLDFLLELMCREQADIWLPKVLAVSNLQLKPASATAPPIKPEVKDAFAALPPKHLVYALRASGKQEALPILLSLLSRGKLDETDRASVLIMAGETATPTEAAEMLQLTEVKLKIAGGSDVEIQQLVAALVRAGQRKVIPAALTEAQMQGLLTFSAIIPGAAELAGLWKQESSRAQLAAWASDADTAAALRQAAVRGLTYLGGAATRDLFQQLAAVNQPAATRVLAINGLADLAPPIGAQQAVAFLADTKTTEEARPVIEAFLKNKKLPAILAKELEGKTIPESAAIEGIRLASSRGMANLIEDALRKAGNVRQMDKPLTPEELKAMVAKVQQLGDAARGEKLYRRVQLLCMTCHAIGETGGLIGPNMVSLGSSAPVDYIIESLLEPSKKIKEGYHMTMVTTKDGQVAAGAIAQDTGTELLIRDAANQVHKVVKANIAQNIISPVSMMPPGLTATLREDEFLDLVRFLSELGREGNYKTPANRFIRTWRVMGAISQPDTDHVRHVGLFALNDRKYAYPWEMKYSLVNGNLPLDELQAPAKMYPWFPKIAQADLEMASAGKVKLKLSTAANVIVTIGEKIIQEVPDVLELDLPAGKSTITFVITKAAGDLASFSVEILDGPAKVVTGP